MEGNGRVLTVLAFSVTAMMLLCLVTPAVVQAAGLIPALPWENGRPWVLLAAAAVIIALAVPVHCRGLHRSEHDPEKRRPWCWMLSFLMNSISNGVAAAALALHLERAPVFQDMLPAVLPGLAVMGVSSLLLVCFPGGKKLILSLAAMAAAVLIVMQFVLEQGTWSAVVGLSIAVFYLFALWLTAGYEHRPVLRDVSFGSFGAALLIAFVVLVVLSDGEALESLDGLGDIGGGDTGFAEIDGARKRRFDRAAGGGSI